MDSGALMSAKNTKLQFLHINPPRLLKTAIRLWELGMRRRKAYPLFRLPTIILPTGPLNQHSSQEQTSTKANRLQNLINILVDSENSALDCSLEMTERKRERSSIGNNCKASVVFSLIRKWTKFEAINQRRTVRSRTNSRFFG